MELSKRIAIAESEDFVVEIGKLTIVSPPTEGNIGYRLINKRTKVVEREGFSESEAIRALWSSQHRLTAVLDDPKGSNEEEVSQEVADYILGNYAGTPQ